MTTLTMAPAQARPTAPHTGTHYAQSSADYNVDEALWAAYRRYDKSAVTEKLLRRYLRATKSVVRKKNSKS